MKTWPHQEIVSMIKMMGGDTGEWSYPVLTSGNKVAVKAEVMVDTFVTVHSFSNLFEDGRSGRGKTKVENVEALRRKERINKMSHSQWDK